MLVNYKTILDPSESMEYRNKLVKSLYSLLGCFIVGPYVGYNLYTFKKNPEVKKVRLFNGMILQFAFSLLNIMWSRQFYALDQALQKKYLEGLPEH